MYPNNPDGSVANFIVFPLDNGWELYLHEDMDKYGKAIERCLAVTETISQMLEYLENKIDGLRGNDILINLFGNDSDKFKTYLWIVPQADGRYALFEEDMPNDRVCIDEDFDIDALVQRNRDKDIIMSF
ncbi:MAG: hypothetical protein ABSG15_13210 [FCB group bacterium]